MKTQKNKIIPVNPGCNRAIGAVSLKTFVFGIAK